MSKALIHIYFLTENSSKIGKSLLSEISKTKVSVIGGGTMGAGISAIFLDKGFKVALVDISEEMRAKAKQHIEGYLEKRRKLSAEKIQAITTNNLTISDSVSSASDSKIVIEAIVEDLSIKQKIFREIEKTVSSQTVISSNTSSLSIDSLSEVLGDSSRAIGFHFFNPAEKMPLVEIVRTKSSSDRTILLSAAYASALGKYPIVVENCPGFLVNRILFPYLVESAQLVSEGYSVLEIDRALVRFGMPMGPLRLLDEIGLDVASKVSEVVELGYGKRMRGPKHATELVKRGRYGRKSKKGFYNYEGKVELPEKSIQTVLGLNTQAPIDRLSEEEIAERLILCMLNEAVRALDEGIAGALSNEALGQIDLGTVMGLGFPAFRGGVMYYAASIGPKRLLDRLIKLQNRHGRRFEPADGIVIRADKGLSFSEPIS